MTAIVYLTAPADQATAEILKNALPPTRRLAVCHSEDALREIISDRSRAVVIFQPEDTPPTPEGLALMVDKVRRVLPSAVCVAMVDGGNIPPELHFQTDCLLLDRSLADFEILNRVSAALRQSDLLATLRDCAQQDEGTNLYNRRYFMQRLGEEISLSKRHLSPLTCVVVGVNFYQVYLDSYGYDFTTALFRHLSAKISTLVRHEDLLARISDDEIGILLPRSTEKGAKVFANRIIQTLDESLFSYRGSEEEISLCTGVAGFPVNGDDTQPDSDAIMRYARHALHQARCSPDDAIRVQLFSEIKPHL